MIYIPDRHLIQEDSYQKYSKHHLHPYHCRSCLQACHFRYQAEEKSIAFKLLEATS